ncbi:MAG: phosphatidic acid phosphatase, partial [Cyclobacteriaceae bacterium]
MKNLIVVTGLIVLSSLLGCNESDEYLKTLKDREIINLSMKQLTDVIVHDIFSPPVASRIYSYSSIAAYEAMRAGQPTQFRTLAGQITDLKEVPAPENEDINFNLASIHAFLTVGTALIFSEDKMKDYQSNLYEKLDEKGLPSSVKKA